MKQNFNIYLASQSPRRIEFLKQLKLKFKNFSVNIDESELENEMPLNYLSRIVNLKKEKAFEIMDPNKKNIIITADTIVVLGNKIFQKPQNDIQAFEFLNILSGRWHNVITGYSISNGKEIDFYNFVKTEVLFKKLKESEINFYITSGEHKDKAGAYAIQGLGSFMIKKIVGSYSNVVGLPISELFEDLQRFKIIEL